MTEITKDELLRIMPYAKERADYFIEWLNACLKEFEINNYNRITFFLAQIAHESGELRYTEELADGKGYEMRQDLGNTLPGDGVKYKGHGLIQITGKTNHFACADYFGVDRQVIQEWLKEPKGATMSAGWFWSKSGLNPIADRGDLDAFLLVTKKINGGLNGIDQRKDYLAKARSALSGA